MARIERLNLPSHFHLEPELLEQLSGRPGHQRCVDGEGELLLVIHEVPEPGVPEREALFFWKRSDNTWVQPSGEEGLGEASALLDRYAASIDGHEEVLNGADQASDLFAVLRHSGPMARCLRNLVSAFNEVLAIDEDDREVMSLRDRANELLRAAELLHLDGKMALEFLQAEHAETQARSTEKLNRIAFRLNLLAGFFLPLVALAGLFGMNVDLPEFVKPMFWAILLGGLVIGLGLLYLVGHKTGSWFDMDDDKKN